MPISTVYISFSGVYTKYCLGMIQPSYLSSRMKLKSLNHESRKCNPAQLEFCLLKLPVIYCLDFILVV